MLDKHPVTPHGSVADSIETRPAIHSPAGARNQFVRATKRGVASKPVAAAAWPRPDVYTALVGVNDELQREVQLLRQRVETIGALKDERDEMRGEVAILQKEINALKADNIALKADNTERNADNIELQRRNEKLRQQLDMVKSAFS